MTNEYISLEIAERIKNVAKLKGKTISNMLEDIGLGRNTMANLKTSIPKADNLAKVADYLECSVDYLLGRTDNLQINSGNCITTGNINGDNNANMRIATECKSDEVQEIMEMIQGLSLVQRSEIVVMISKMKSKK